jgi:hypothetical protein
MTASVPFWTTAGKFPRWKKGSLTLRSSKWCKRESTYILLYQRRNGIRNMNWKKKRKKKLREQEE